MKCKIFLIHRNIDYLEAEAAESREYIKGLAACATEVIIVKIGAAEAPPAREFKDVRVVSFPSERAFSRGLAAVVRNLQPDVAHIKALWTPAHAAAAKTLRRLGVPYVVEPGGHLNPYLLRNRFGGKMTGLLSIFKKAVWRGFVDLPMCRAASGLRALSRWEAEQMRSLGLNHVVTLPLGVNSEWVLPRESKSVGTRAGGGPLTVGYLGRLDIIQKGLDLLLEAARLFKERAAFNVRCILAGPDLGGSAQTIRRSIEAAGLTNTTLLGPQMGEDKRKFLMGIDLFYHCSRLEEMAKLAREAVGAGVPVLASAESNFGDWVQEHHAGLMTKLDAGDIVKTIEILLNYPNWLAKMRSNTLTFCEPFTWDNVARQMMEFYAEILRRRQPC